MLLLFCFSPKIALQLKVRPLNLFSLGSEPKKKNNNRINQDWVRTGQAGGPRGTPGDWGGGTARAGAGRELRVVSEWSGGAETPWCSSQPAVSH